MSGYGRTTEPGGTWQVKEQRPYESGGPGAIQSVLGGKDWTGQC